MVIKIPQTAKRIIILNLVGKNGSGKSEQRKRLCQKYNLYVISTGDNCRNMIERKYEPGSHLFELQNFFHDNNFEEVMTKGGLLPNDFIKQMLNEEMKFAFNKGFRGVVLDGAVRNSTQAADTDMMLEDLGYPISLTIFINVPDAEVEQRCSARYALEQRKDDHPDKVKTRLEVYNEQTSPLSAYYSHPSASPAVHIDGVGKPEVVFSRIQPYTDLLLKTQVCYIR